MSCGTVCAPGQRYHPAVIAQAAATLSRMYGDRFWLALGSGEALNEHITGEAWPSKPHRQARLEECVDVMRQLWAGETVSVRGHITVDEARVYSRPLQPPLVVGAAVSEQSAAWVAGWADALITVASEPDTLRRVVDAFRENGGANKPMFLQSCVVFAPEREGRAVMQREWPQCTLDNDTLADVASAETFEALTRDTSPDATAGCARISDSVDRHIEWLEGDRDLGFERVYLHDVSRQPPYFAETWARRLLQAFADPLIRPLHR